VCSCGCSLLLVCELPEPEFEYEPPPFELEDCVELEVLSPLEEDASSDEFDVSSSSSVEESSVFEVVVSFFVDLFVCVVVVVVDPDALWPELSEEHCVKQSAIIIASTTTIAAHIAINIRLSLKSFFIIFS
jgi:hypothetical protein